MDSPGAGSCTEILAGAKLIIQSGIREVVFLSDKHHDAMPFVASRRLLDLAGVRYRQHIPVARTITIDFASIM